MRVGLKVGIGMIAAGVASGVAQADIIGYEQGKAVLVRKPQNQKYIVDGYDKKFVFLWNEKSGVTLPNDLAVDILGPALGGPEGRTYYAKNELGTYWIPRGTQVESEYLVFNPQHPHFVETTVRFSGAILGVLVESDWPKVDRLFTTDGFALYDVPRENLPSYRYDLRGLDFPLTRNQSLGTDENWIRVGIDEITVHLGGAHPGDHIRVITRSSMPQTPPVGHVMPMRTGVSSPARSGSRGAPTRGTSPRATQSRSVPQPHVSHVRPGHTGTPTSRPVAHPVARPRQLPRQAVPVRHP